MLDSRVLFLITGSNTKQKGGETNYHPASTISSLLPEDPASLLIKSRARVLRLIRRGGFIRHGVRIAELPSNQTLEDGPEFGGTSQKGLYLPAYKRFRGRLYKELETEGVAFLAQVRHHILIVTGLYGLITPLEPIQDHQIDINDDPSFREVWTGDDRLTNILVAYMKQFGITHVFDLTAQNSYRFLIAWERVRVETRRVLHCYGKQTVGSEFLIPLGYLIRELSQAPEDRLLNIQANTSFETPYEQVYFQPLPRPPANAPHELEHQRVELNIADELGRMRRCVIRMLDAIGDHTARMSDDGVQGIIRQLLERGLLPSEIADSMLDITRTRNKVEYDEYQVPDTRITSIRNKYTQLKEWATAHRLRLPSECLEV